MQNMLIFMNIRQDPSPFSLTVDQLSGRTALGMPTRDSNTCRLTSTRRASITELLHNFFSYNVVQAACYSNINWESNECYSNWVSPDID